MCAWRGAGEIRSLVYSWREAKAPRIGRADRLRKCERICAVPALWPGQIRAKAAKGATV
jgi:hypothetical protein